MGGRRIGFAKTKRATFSNYHTKAQYNGAGGLTRWNAKTFPAWEKLDVMYTETEVQLSCAAGGVAGAEAVWRLNSIYDPYFTGAGNQPESYTTLSSVYRRYIVYWVDIRVRCYSATQETLLLGVSLQGPDSSYTLTGKVSSDFEKDRQIQTCNPGQSGAASPAYAHPEIVLNHVSLPQLAGISLTEYKANLYQFGGAFGANPSNSLYMRIACSDMDGQNTGSCKVQVSIRFHGKVFDRLQPLP